VFAGHQLGDERHRGLEKTFGFASGSLSAGRIERRRLALASDP
jgi:hypothetical protein